MESTTSSGPKHAPPKARYGLHLKNSLRQPSPQEGEKLDGENPFLTFRTMLINSVYGLAASYKASTRSLLQYIQHQSLLLKICFCVGLFMNVLMPFLFITSSAAKSVLLFTIGSILGMQVLLYLVGAHPVILSPFLSWILMLISLIIPDSGPMNIEGMSVLLMQPLLFPYLYIIWIHSLLVVDTLIFALILYNLSPLIWVDWPQKQLTLVLPVTLPLSSYKLKLLVQSIPQNQHILGEVESPVGQPQLSMKESQMKTEGWGEIPKKSPEFKPEPKADEFEAPEKLGESSHRQQSSTEIPPTPMPSPSDLKETSSSTSALPPLSPSLPAMGGTTLSEDEPTSFKSSLNPTAAAQLERSKIGAPAEKTEGEKPVIFSHEPVSASPTINPTAAANLNRSQIGSIAKTDIDKGSKKSTK